jgi:hypothetical protein
MSTATATNPVEDLAASEELPPELVEALTYAPEAVAAAKLKPFKVSERPTYYDPSAAGASGPHLRYPNKRAYLSFQYGAITPVNPLEEEMVRAYLGGQADKCKGQTLAEPLVCNCGVRLGNQYVAREHKLKFPDALHAIQF